MPDPIRLAILTGSPNPVKVPLFQLLASDPRLEFTAIYASSQGLRVFDNDWAYPAPWDIDLTNGYRALFLRSSDRTPGLGKHFLSVRNWDVVSVLVRGRFDVLLVWGYNSLTYVLAVATQRACGRQVLFSEEQTMLDPRSLSNTLAKEVALRLLFKNGRAVCLSTNNRRWFEHYGIRNDRLHFAPFAIDNAAYQAAATRLLPRRDEIRRSLGIAAECGPVIVSVSRLVPDKQPEVLLEAFRRVRENHACTLLIVGSGRLECDLKRQVAEQAIPDVVFTGFLNRSQIYEAFAAADVFALLSREHETFGLVVNEAMNFGLPVVTSDRVGCAADLVGNDLNGFVVSSRDPRDAACALATLVADPDLRQTMGTASRVRIDGWTLERMTRGILEAATESMTSASRAHAEGRRGLRLPRTPRCRDDRRGSV